MSRESWIYTDRSGAKEEAYRNVGYCPGDISRADFFLFCEKIIKKMSINISCNRLYKVCIMKHKLKTRFSFKKSAAMSGCI